MWQSPPFQTCPSYWRFSWTLPCWTWWWDESRRPQSCTLRSHLWWKTENGVTPEQLSQETLLFLTKNQLEPHKVKLQIWAVMTKGGVFSRWTCLCSCTHMHAFYTCREIKGHVVCSRAVLWRGKTQQVLVARPQLNKILDAFMFLFFLLFLIKTSIPSREMRSSYNMVTWTLCIEWVYLFLSQWTKIEALQLEMQC